MPAPLCAQATGCWASTGCGCRTASRVGAQGLFPESWCCGSRLGRYVAVQSKRGFAPFSSGICCRPPLGLPPSPSQTKRWGSSTRTVF